MESQVYIPFSPTAGGLPYTTTIQKMSDPKERFYRHFQTEITGKPAHPPTRERSPHPPFRV
jgi:hypothetical protein